MKLTASLLFLTWFFAFVYAEDAESPPSELPPSDIPPYGIVYFQEYPRANPSYCTGFTIEYPIASGLAFEIGSTQEIHWAVNKSAEFVPDFIFRIRIINSTQHFHYIVQGASELYTKGEENKGAVSFPLNVVGGAGSYHYRIMVNYPNQAVHCIYESVPFTLLGNPNKNEIRAGAPYPYVNPEGKFQTAIPPNFGMKYPLGS